MFHNASIDELPVLLDRIPASPDSLRDADDWLDDEILPLEKSLDADWIVQPFQKPIPSLRCLQTLKFDHPVRRILIHQEILFTVGSPTRNSPPEATNTIQGWNWQTGNHIFAFTGHTAPIRMIALSQDGKTLVSGSEDQTIKVWNALTGEEWMTLEDHTSPITAIALSPDGKTLVSSGCNQYENRDRQLRIVNRDRALRIWNLSEGKVTHTLPCITDVPMLSMGASGKVLLKYEQQLEAVNVETGRPIPRLNTLKECEQILAIASDWENVATIVDRQVTIRQLTTGEVLSRIPLNLYDRSIQVCALSPDGKWFAAGFARTEIHSRHNSYLTRRNILRIWDTQTGHQVICLDESELGQGMWQSIGFGQQGLLITSVGACLKVWRF
ncbi:WD40 repeat domain-containing protein [Leptolyngbya sp. NIES-2104]|uniref:WD40 repeat domain-containing protein n=1 Tax=Leptolyngbya sp. NIES-2104 TaxID=1552121 RepID=UPI0006EC4C20|nr:PD40 domain-containing protein [Leptolyngbya sp. NIES-2104]GAP98567.1 high-affnity carbon uptake protein Hat/HatR [Leptolyngbya sp. NIES-2104]